MNGSRFLTLAVSMCFVFCLPVTSTAMLLRLPAVQGYVQYGQRGLETRPLTSLELSILTDGSKDTGIGLTSTPGPIPDRPRLKDLLSPAVYVAFDVSGISDHTSNLSIGATARHAYTYGDSYECIYRGSGDGAYTPFDGASWDTAVSMDRQVTWLAADWRAHETPDHLLYCRVGTRNCAYGPTPGDVDYAAFTLNIYEFNVWGTVPEPSGFCLLFAGIGGVLASQGRRLRR